MQQLSTWFQWLFPPCCHFCGQPNNTPCCANCATSLQVYRHTCCHRCSEPLPESLGVGPCGHCINHPPPQQHSQVLYVYEGAVRQAILNWKLKAENAAFAHLLSLATPRLIQQFKADDLLLPVPAPLSRMRQSGIHHSADLCRQICAITGSQWNWRYLRRVGEQPRQSTLSGKERRHNLRHAFQLSPHHSPPAAQRIWIVDDVMTTGSTLLYAAKTVCKRHPNTSVFSLAKVPLKTK